MYEKIFVRNKHSVLTSTLVYYYIRTNEYDRMCGGIAYQTIIYHRQDGSPATSNERGNARYLHECIAAKRRGCDDREKVSPGA